jgi:hypothetical protein
MASPFSGLVLGSGALLASPALWDAFVEGTLPVQTAIMRLLVAIVVSWLGYSMLGSLLEQTADPVRRTDEAPRALPGIDGPITVRAAVVEKATDDTDPTPS